MEDRDIERYQMGGKVVLRHIGEETLLVPVSGAAADGWVYPINETDALIWAGCLDGYVFAEIEHTLMDLFDVDAEDARADCEACVDRFLSENLLEECTS